MGHPTAETVEGRAGSPLWREIPSAAYSCLDYVRGQRSSNVLNAAYAQAGRHWSQALRYEP
ncbi:hypothetical protein [Roseibium polysiphoniae]|uniref:Uncharacterized protein n=1 Tax=Roseibium polysiphoniae TaxID=2571221 RepID=A0ABR9C9V1_9HYPH|nr:hypothetical protein [Roseibium polysiphoniae]MBD8876319.1 hypothetical protein [Roseibium polysiphoniae]